MKSDSFVIGPGGEVVFAAPKIKKDDHGNVISHAVFSFAGAEADHEIALQCLDPKSGLWRSTDRIFIGERYRLAFFRTAGPKEKRIVWFKDIDTSVPNKKDRFIVWYAAIIMALMIFLVFMLAIMGGMR